VTAGLVALSILVPPAVLSLARTPADYFTFNPWLTRLPDYVASPDVPLATKVEKLWALALFWFSADSPFGGTDWGFAVDVADLARITFTSALFGLYFALWRHLRGSRPGLASGPGVTGHRGGVLGATLSVCGLSTGPCSVVGCGAPVMPVVGLALAGLSSGTIKLLSDVSSIAGAAVLIGLAGGVAYLGRVAGAEHRERP
jgi:hypothetical protein